MNVKKIFIIIPILLLLVLPEMALADYTQITTNNTATTTAVGTLAKPWIEFMVAWGFIIAFIMGLGGSFAYQWSKAKEERKDTFGIFVKSVLIAILIAWAALTITDIIVENLTGTVNKGTTIRNTYWNAII